ncbi:hypothetical protein BBJ29_006691 [Phytophthora kernoviae]|uniref:Uncharacterized protein n=1 Tax=Phytophthora kernoviae TaxID=325452 RepID=A0A3F2RFN3_9STRA|nr:hypothetical protein BBP00_00008347 [Phytophthora kernoviae]RLN71702.1 hypothetical protein BBJ29_006691 [Phytophthora kernoviae]
MDRQSVPPARKEALQSVKVHCVAKTPLLARSLTMRVHFLGGVNCSIAESGEVYEYVEWLRLILDLPGIERSSLVGDGGDEHEYPIDDLVQAWTDTLTGYSVSVRQMHLLQVSTVGVFLEIVVAVETHFAKTKKSELKESSTDAAHNVVEATESALEELLEELGGSAARGQETENDDEKLANLVMTSSFREALARQFGRVNLLDGALSSSILNVSIADPPFRSTRAVCKKFRRLCVGDRDMQERIESEALLAAVRTHGRTFDGVQYSPMGVISADTMVNKDT